MNLRHSEMRPLAGDRPRLRSALALVMLLLLALLASSGARAHDFNPGVLALHARDGERTWDVMWTAPVDTRGAPANVDVVFPQHCKHTDRTLQCEHALTGVIAFTGLHDPTMQIIVSLHRASGDVQEHLVLGAAPAVTLGARSEGTLVWLRVGVEHIMFGPDHLAFVIGLVLVLRRARLRRIVATLTAFTIAHSVTLALAVLDVVQLPRGPVEACIALSVVLVAREALSGRDTLLVRAPWLVAALFGFVHGLGFAGALTELGIPRGAIASTLLAFNVGIELGQVAVVAVALVHARVVPARVRAPGRVVVATTLGACGAWWLIDRVIG